jgi:hypothetical protein
MLDLLVDPPTRYALLGIAAIALLRLVFVLTAPHDDGPPPPRDRRMW